MTSWRSFVPSAAPTDRDTIFQEIEQLAGPAMNRRKEAQQEILDQDGRLVGWFAQTMMLSPSAHPNTIMVLLMASQVAKMVAITIRHVSSARDRSKSARNSFHW